MNSVQGLSYFTCDIVDRWPSSAKIRILEIGAPLVTVTLKVGNAYFAGAGKDITEAIWSLDRQWTAGITGARFAVDVLMAISKKPNPITEKVVRDMKAEYGQIEGEVVNAEYSKCAHPLCADSDECIDNYDGGDDGDAWSGGFAENH